MFFRCGLTHLDAIPIFEKSFRLMRHPVCLPSPSVDQNFYCFFYIPGASQLQRLYYILPTDFLDLQTQLDLQNLQKNLHHLTNESKGSQISKYEISSLKIQDSRPQDLRSSNCLIMLKIKKKYLKNFRSHDPRSKDLMANLYMYNPKMAMYLHYGSTGCEVFI